LSHVVDGPGVRAVGEQAAMLVVDRHRPIESPGEGVDQVLQLFAHREHGSQGSFRHSSRHGAARRDSCRWPRRGPVRTVPSVDAPPGPVVAVLVKAVPVGGTFLRPDGDRLSRGSLAHGIDPVNELALERALEQREAGRVARVVAVTMGPAWADDAVRRALALGCDDVTVVRDDRLAGADVGTTAKVLAAAIAEVGAELAVFGYESLDGSSGAVPAAVAAQMGRPFLGFARRAALDGRRLCADRDVGSGEETLRASLPAVLAMVDGAEPRYPTLREVLAARKLPVRVVDLDALGVPAPARPRERVVALRAAPTTGRQGRRVDGEHGAAAIMDLLRARGLLDG
jgi:electron transfer flavoprotein beta subunit